MAGFLDAMRDGKPGSVPLAKHAEVRENSKVVTLRESAWRRVQSIKSKVTFADPVSGNVVTRAGVGLADGKPGYISTRLKVVAGGRIADVELSSDTGPRVNPDYVWALDGKLADTLPIDQRRTRVELEALGLRYFHSLSTHVAVKDDFDDEKCNRYHSGQQITNVVRNSVEGRGSRTCVQSIEGNPPWGPATEQRFPMIDPERGIVMAVTLLHLPKNPDGAKMYVSEIFKIVDGRIVLIDNIGLVQSIDTLGFLH